MTPTQQTQVESHLGSGAPVVSGAAVGEHGGICLDDLLFSARDSGRAQACEAGRPTVPWTEREMAQESPASRQPLWARSSKACRVLPHLCHIPCSLGWAEGENRASLQRVTRNKMPPSPIPRVQGWSGKRQRAGISVQGRL